MKEKGTVYEQYVADANEYRAMTLRVVYALDEFVWEAPAGRQRTIVDAMTVQETMQMADEVIVPNSELAGAIKDLGLVSEYTDVLVIPTFMNEYFYPINRITNRMASLSTMINKPKILVKGTCIPKNVQNFIISTCRDLIEKVIIDKEKGISINLKLHSFLMKKEEVGTI